MDITFDDALNAAEQIAKEAYMEISALTFYPGNKEWIISLYDTEGSTFVELNSTKLYIEQIKEHYHTDDQY